MTNSLIDYWDALERLKRNKPERTARGAKITNDTVSLEAGRGKGSIKKSRDGFSALILAIDEAAATQAAAENVDQVKLDKAKASATNYRAEWEAAVSRELSLVHEVYSLKKQLAALTGGNVLPLRPQAAKRE